MSSAFPNLRVYPSEPRSQPAEDGTDTPLPALAPIQLPNPDEFANRELIRPLGYGRRRNGAETGSPAWFDELEQSRYSRHGAWLPSSLEFARHPGESVLVVGPGLGLDVVRYLREGTEVTVAVNSTDPADLIRRNLKRLGLNPPILPIYGDRLPADDGTRDVVVWNALHEDRIELTARAEEMYRVLKPGGKIIGLFPARYDAGFWQDVFLPLQYIYWRRPADPTSGRKTSGRDLRRAFSRFSEHRVAKRHLRRSELPHLWRVLPLVVLERFLGRVLVFKAFKPLSSARTIAPIMMNVARAA